MLRPASAFLALCFWLMIPGPISSEETDPGETPSDSPRYAVVVSASTHRDPEWRAVADALVARHDARIITYESSVRDSLDDLRSFFPRYAGFVARPSEASRAFVAEVHRITRLLDQDPYTDLFWGIVTGHDAACALRIVRHEKPLIVRKVAAGTEVALEMCEEGVWYCELNQHHMVRKEEGGEPEIERAPADTTKALVDCLNEYRADLFVTSGHATERDWQIGYRYRNGSFRSEDGRLFGVDTEGKRYRVRSDHPRVYLPVGNCLMGHIDGPDAMALAFLESAGVHQMIGYTVPTWYGYAGWGCLDYFVEQPGRFTLAEAFLANHHALVHRLLRAAPSLARAEPPPGRPPRSDLKLTPRARELGLSLHDLRGLLFDRDVLAFYGDPAWEARMAPGPLRWTQELKESRGVYTFEVRPRGGEETFAPVNNNGSQRGGRPLVHFFPHRLRDVEIVEGEELAPLITDTFLLLPSPREGMEASSLRIVFRAKRVD